MTRNSNTILHTQQLKKKQKFSKKLHLQTFILYRIIYKNRRQVDPE